ncbi:alkaline phosphatase family protein [Arachidicoccus ginsenosidivorans]|uniref:alkaline phosphatase family protein n=1 Tax=Arachidicoccus ginsenosidivorans TaxID=496057 RepID=UPI0021D056E9|nr:ectonucleotide pyrophosphatase/phosphodiesterase [Arachidicoccus ginsenosidivorans]
MKLSYLYVKRLFLCGLIAFCLISPLSITGLLAQDTVQQVVPGRENLPAQEKKPYLIMISIDGFRWDLADKYNARFLKKMRSCGVEAKSMQPSYPSLTFPNHYAIITGLYPAHHGLVDNYFYDPKKQATYKVSNKNAVRDSSWYGGEPLWVLAEKAGMLTASFYWVGSEAAIDGVRPTYYYKYNEKIPIDSRISAVKSWLELPEAKRPHLITFYFPEVDHMEHLHGVDAPETAAAVKFVDQSIEQLYDSCKLTGLPINFIVLSDHGFANLDTTKYLSAPVLDTSHYLIRGAVRLRIFMRGMKWDREV